MNSPWIARGTTVAATLFGAACFVILHLSMPHVHPVQQPVSMFAVEEAGFIAFNAATLGLALACLALAMTHASWPRVTLIGGSVFYVLSVIFPTDPGKGLETVSAHIHRYASGTAFGFVILAGFVAVVMSRRSTMRYWVLALTIVNLLTMLTITVNTFFPEFLDGNSWRGLPQRILIVAQAALLTMLAFIPAIRPRDKTYKVDSSL